MTTLNEFPFESSCLKCYVRFRFSLKSEAYLVEIQLTHLILPWKILISSSFLRFEIECFLSFRQSICFAKNIRKIGFSLYCITWVYYNVNYGRRSRKSSILLNCLLEFPAYFAIEWIKGDNIVSHCLFVCFLVIRGLNSTGGFHFDTRLNLYLVHVICAEPSHEKKLNISLCTLTCEYHVKLTSSSLQLILFNLCLFLGIS